jgi:hypothetical protein
MKKTKVLFLLETDSDTDATGEVFAYFPEENYGSEADPKLVICYAHIGQHSPCHPAYAEQCQTATPEQYADLKSELESIGYNLQVLN